MNQSSSWNPLDSMVGRNLLQGVPKKRRLDFHLIAPATCRQMTPTSYENLYASMVITKISLRDKRKHELSTQK